MLVFLYITFCHAICQVIYVRKISQNSCQLFVHYFFFTCALKVYIIKQRTVTALSKLSERLRTLRNEKGLSQQGLADQIGISKSNINMYERGEREPSIARLEVLADYFNVDMDYLLGLSDIPNKYQFSLRCSSAVSSLVPLAPSEEHLLGLYRSFNDEGQEKLLAYAEDLDRTGIYKNNRESDVVPKKA